MENELNLNESVKEALEIALIKLMRKKDINKIKVTELCEAAGVGRSSFYRNFEGLEDIAVSYVNRIYSEYFRERPVNPDIYKKGTYDFFLKERFRFIRKNGDFFTAINRNGMLYEVMRRMDANVKTKFLVSDVSESEYFTAMTMGFTAGIIEEWVERGMKESEEEMAVLVKTCLISIARNFKEPI